MPSSIKQVDPAENEFLASLEARSKQPNLFFRALANRPEVLKTFVPFYGAVMAPGTVPRRIQELVYLTCSYANQCAFCTAAHTASGKKAGITEQEMQSLQAAGDSGPGEGFSEPELAAIRYARELARTANAATTRQALAAHFNSEQMVEITLIAATANWTNRFNNGLQIIPES
jgi:AhpD family alkylhydroperoxidase